MATSGFQNCDGPGRAGIEGGARSARQTGARNARQLAIGLLSHRLNGGLTNAVMAFELAVMRAAAGNVPLVTMLQGGLAGAQRAARAANLLDVLVSDAVPITLEADEYLVDVLELLHDHASRRGHALSYVADTAAAASVPSAAGDAARALLAGLAAMERCPGSGRMCVRFVQRGDGPWFELDSEQRA